MEFLKLVLSILQLVIWVLRIDYNLIHKNIILLFFHIYIFYLYFVVTLKFIQLFNLSLKVLLLFIYNLDFQIIGAFSFDEYLQLFLFFKYFLLVPLRILNKGSPFERVDQFHVGLILTLQFQYFLFQMHFLLWTDHFMYIHFL